MQTTQKTTQMTADQKNIVKSDTSKSAKIRALAEQGMPRADIARVLGIKYQFVRNVLVQAQNREPVTQD